MISATRMETIAEKKKKIIDDLDILRKNYIIVIYKGIVNKKSVREIHKALLDETITNIENKLAIDNNLLKYAKKLAVKNCAFARQQKDEKMSFIAPVVFRALTSGAVFKDMQKIMHDFARGQEAQLKNDMIANELKRNRERENPRIFYIASKHLDCAIDHLDYQGKVYVDEKWRTLIKDRELKQRVAKYIDTHGVKTFQWVIGKPVWFITRPNCRHFFKDVDTNTMLDNSVDSLRELYNLNRIAGTRTLMQTIWHDTRKEWYNKTNVKNIIRQYEDRLDLHKKLKKVYYTNDIEYAIKKDKLLIEKWKKYYKEHLQ